MEKYTGKNGRLIEVDGLVAKISKDGKTVEKEFPNEEALNKYLELVKATPIKDETPEEDILDDGFGDLYEETEEENEVIVEGVLVDIRDLLFKDIPVIPNNHGVESIFIFAVRAETKEFVVGENAEDINPKIVPIKAIVSQIPKEFLEEIAVAKATAKTPEEMEKKIFEIFEGIDK